MSHLPDKVADARDRIIEKLSQENKELKYRLAVLMDNARHNEIIMSHFDEIEKIVLTSQSLPELLKLLIEDIRQRFGLQYVQVGLKDSLGNPLWSLSSLLGPNVRHIRFLKVNELARFLSFEAGPLLVSDPPSESREYFFGKDYRQIRSMAVIPLRDQENILGCLCLGSRSTKRYHPDNQSQLLERLGTKVAIGLKNAIAHQRLEQMAVRDIHTGLFSRHYLDDRITAEFQRVERYGHQLACAVIDVDGLKTVNDQLGHAEGDKLLQRVAEALRNSVRNSDAIIHRGEAEFVILFPSTSLKNAIHASRNIISRLSAIEFRIGERRYPVSVSIGLAQCPHPEIRSGEELLRVAGHWMYVAKNKGGGRVEW